MLSADWIRSRRESSRTGPWDARKVLIRFGVVKNLSPLCLVRSISGVTVAEANEYCLPVLWDLNARNSRALARRREARHSDVTQHRAAQRVACRTRHVSLDVGDARETFLFPRTSITRRCLSFRELMKSKAEIARREIAREASRWRSSPAAGEATKRENIRQILEQLMLSSSCECVGVSLSPLDLCFYVGSAVVVVFWRRFSCERRTNEGKEVH